MQAQHHVYVFQRQPPDFLSEEPICAPDFAPVAYIIHTGSPAEAVERAFRETNTLDRGWWEGLGRYPRAVGAAFGRNFRSTSIGDLAIVGHRVWRWTHSGPEWCADVEALPLITQIPDPRQMLEGMVQVLASKYQLELSLGYIGNLWTTGLLKERDDRCHSIYCKWKGARDHARWGRYATSELPLMAEHARALVDGKCRLEHWAAALSQCNYPLASRLEHAPRPS